MDFMDYVGWGLALLMTVVAFSQLGTIELLKKKLSNREVLLAETSRLLHRARADSLEMSIRLAKHDRDYFDKPAGLPEAADRIKQLERELGE